MARIYSVREYYHSQPFTVIDDREAEYYRNAGFIVDETQIATTAPVVTGALFISMLVAFFILGGYIFGYDLIAKVYLAFAAVYGILWLTSHR